MNATLWLINPLAHYCSLRGVYLSKKEHNSSTRLAEAVESVDFADLERTL